MKHIFKQFEAWVINLRADNFKRAVVRLTVYYTIGVGIILAVCNVLVYVLFLVQTGGVLRKHEEIMEGSQTLSEEVFEHLIDVLVMADVLTLCVTVVVGYIYARKTMAPLSEMYEAQKRFVADAAHELRTPLAVMKAGAEMLLQRARTAEEYTQFIQDTQSEVNRLITLSNDLLFCVQSSHVQKNAEYPISLSDICIEQSTRMYTYAHTKGVTIHTDIQPEVCIVGNRDEIARLVLNLLKNAVDYNIPTGSVKVALTSRQTQVILSIADTGIGISADDVVHIFERFYKADSARTQQNHIGSGLGLAIVKQIVDTHAGTIHVESVVGEGTTFRVVFPSV